MLNNESVGKKIVEALKKQSENLQEETISSEIDINTEQLDNTGFNNLEEDAFFIEQPKTQKNKNFFDEEDDDNSNSFFETSSVEPTTAQETINEIFEIPANIVVLKKLISQLPSGVSRHTGAQIIKQTMEALGISMKSVLQDAQQVQENLKISARDCQTSIQEYKKQIMTLEKQAQTYQKQYSALNDLISLFIQTTR